jgi:two-component system, chemotaxis family, CheB/CheR fusion protein
MEKKTKEIKTSKKKLTTGKASQLQSEDISPLQEKTFSIVGIGASAGGLESLEQFFRHTPPDSGLAFVVVQHLDPTRHSSMPEIMSRLTSMTVHAAADGMKVVPNTIYLIPPNKNMGIQEGALFLQDPTQLHGLRLPVDFFLRSLAKEKGAHAICVILSGTGTDGTLGLRAIKAELGTVFVQEPQSARYDGMPRSAINTGLADFVLPPEEMPQKLMRFAKNSVVNGARISAEGEKANQPLQQVFAILRTRTGHDFSRYKQSTILRRLERRMSVNGINNISDYSRFLGKNEPEVRAFLKDILISVTSFFRDPGAFDALKEQVCELMKGKDNGSDLRVWVPGCATGEEAYSTAMIILECLEELQRSLPVQIYATDIDTDALAVARAGIYPANIGADVSPERRKRFFIKQENSYQVKKNLREMVVFAPQDFIKDPPFSRMDLICCRNLLIYLENDIQKRLLPLLHYAIRPRGILFLGPSETVGEAADIFTTLHKQWKIFQRREVAVIPERLIFPSAFAPFLSEPRAELATDPTARIPALTEKIFLDNYAPTFAVIDEKYRLIYVRGRTGKYLEIASGQPSLSIMEMAREGLRSELQSAIFEAASEKKASVREGVKVKHNGGFQITNLTVAPLTERGIPPGYMMIVFQEAGMAAREEKIGPSGGRRVAKIENDLKLTRENLQRTIEELEASNEELKTSNEELQSNNQELQSTNEELDTSREELQSLNEEMATVNTELATKNELLTTAIDDLKNYLNRTDIAIIFLDKDLKIRSYTPATADVFNIRDIDINRPLNEITSRLAYEKVVEDAGVVLRMLTPKEMEVQRKDGRWYTMRILPYLTVKNDLGGLVISFLDIDQQKNAVNELIGVNKRLQEALEEQKKVVDQLHLLATVVEDSNDAIIIQNLKGKILTWNKGAEWTYGYSEEEALSMNIASLVPEEARAQARQLFKSIKQGIEIPSLEVRRLKKDGGIIDVWLTMTKLVDDRGLPNAIATTERDITERKRTEKGMETMTERLRSLSHRLIKIQEKERTNIARELHDQIGQSLNLVKLLIDRAKTADDKDRDKLYSQASPLLAELIDRVSTLSLDLRPKILDDLGLVRALEWYFERFTAQTNIRIQFKSSGIDKQLQTQITNSVYRVVQEALTNVARHAHATTVIVALKAVQSTINLCIEDNGIGFDPAGIDTSSSGGIIGMQERISLLGGTLQVQSKPGAGARIVVELPYRKEEKKEK